MSEKKEKVAKFERLKLECAANFGNSIEFPLGWYCRSSGDIAWQGFSRLYLMEDNGRIEIFHGRSRICIEDEFVEYGKDLEERISATEFFERILKDRGL